MSRLAQEIKNLEVEELIIYLSIEVSLETREAALLKARTLLNCFEISVEEALKLLSSM